jgi:hypothetical protein
MGMWAPAPRHRIPARFLPEPGDHVENRMVILLLMVILLMVIPTDPCMEYLPSSWDYF